MLSASSEDLIQLRGEFQSFNHIRLPGLLEEQLLNQIDRRIANSAWQEMIHEGIGVESCVSDKGVEALLNFLLNNETLFRIINQITDCGPIGSFGGRLYRMNPQSGHHDSWHTDMGDYRLLALTINLSKAAYQGGILQISERKSGAPLLEIPNTGFGDAILFRLSSNLQHRVTNLAGTIPKTAFAGWFKSQPAFSTLLHQHKGIPKSF